ncbi:MAG: hypothetical protein LBE56_01330, partial [Tannerella sp.]|nr:hypothetical protein [Tannerella sp.]
NYKVPSDDYDNLKIYPESGGITHDRFHAYYLDRNLNYDLKGNLLTDTIDIATFKVTGYLDCHDKFGTINVFRGRIEK